MARPFRRKNGGPNYCIPYKDHRGKWRRITGPARYADALEQQANLLRKIKRERDDPLQREIGRGLENYLRERRGAGGRWSSYLRLKTDLAGWMKFGGESGGAVRTWQDALPDRLNAWLDRAQAGKLPGQRRPWAAATVNGTLARVRAFCRWAMGRGVIDRDPTVKICRRRGELRKVRRALAKSECEDLLRLAACDTERDLFGLFVMAGLRLNEALTLRWSDLELRPEYGQLHVRPEVAKSRSARIVPLPDRLRAVFIARKARFCGSTPESMVFERWVKRYREPASRLRREIRRIGKKLGWPRLEEIDIHSLRVTFVTLADAAGYSRNTIRVLVGHRRFGQLEKYLKDLPAVASEQLNRFGCVLPLAEGSDFDEKREGRKGGDFATPGISRTCAIAESGF